MINVVFCFDDNLTRQVRVAVSSLLEASKAQGSHYHIYCICTGNADSVEDDLRMDIKKRDSQSELTLLKVEDSYADSYQVREITTATYLRLMLPDLLPEVKKIIYADIDILFTDSLQPVWDMDMSGVLIAGVKSAVNLPDKWEWNSAREYWHMLDFVKGSYFNAGFTILNLELMRSMGLKSRWDELAKMKLYYQDQDILNMTCGGKVLFLDPKWNTLAYIKYDEYMILVDEGIISKEQADEAWNNPVVIHYAGDKPWNRYDANFCDRWWDFVKTDKTLYELFDEKKARKNHGPSIWFRFRRKIRRTLGLENEYE